MNVVHRGHGSCFGSSSRRLPGHYAGFMEADRRRRRITYTAPIGCVDLAAFDEAGEPFEIHSCPDCLPWHAEVHIDDDGEVFVREWHAIECETFEQLTKPRNGLPDN